MSKITWKTWKTQGISKLWFCGHPGTSKDTLNTSMESGFESVPLSFDIPAAFDTIDANFCSYWSFEFGGFDPTAHRQIMLFGHRRTYVQHLEIWCWHSLGKWLNLGDLLDFLSGKDGVFKQNCLLGLSVIIHPLLPCIRIVPGCLLFSTETSKTSDVN